MDRPREVLAEQMFRRLLAREADRASRYHYFFSVCLVAPDLVETPFQPHIEIRNAVATKIAEFLRSTDMVGHLRDRTALVLLHTASPDAVRVAERVRRQIERVSFPGALGSPPRRITLSVGGVSFPRDGSTDKLLLSRAELNLQEAARLGGNRVVCESDNGSSRGLA